MSGREREFTAGLARWFGPSSRVPVGIGDDAAVVENTRGRTVVTCDPVVEGVHFAADCDPTAIGRKAVLRNLSDLAAMGALPDYLVVSVLLPKGTTRVRRDAVFEGLRSAAAEHGCAVVGGDTGATPGPLVVTVTVLGHLVASPLLRSGAAVGDTLHVTGPLGGAGTGRHLEPVPRLAEAAWLARHAVAAAAIDVSDGLALDLCTMLRAARLEGAEIFEAALPIHADAADRSDPARSALHDGEDYELLFTCHRDVLWPDGGPLTARARQPIGRILPAPGLWLVRRDGSREAIDDGGYQHRV